MVKWLCLDSQALLVCVRKVAPVASASMNLWLITRPVMLLRLRMNSASEAFNGNAYIRSTRTGSALFGL